MPDLMMPEPAILDRELTDRIAWEGASLPREAGLLPIGPAAMAELEAVAEDLAAHPLPILALAGLSVLVVHLLFERMLKVLLPPGVVMPGVVMPGWLGA